MNLVLDDSITSVEYNGTPVDVVEFNGVEVWRANKDDWRVKDWSGLTSFSASGIWTDGTDVYYSNGSTQRVLDKSTSTWNEKTWRGLTPSLFYTQYIWTDGTDVYYSNESTQKVLDKSTSTWNTKTWSGLTSFSASGIWTDGTDVYHSYSIKVTGKEYYFNSHHILNKSESTWSSKTFPGLSETVPLYGYFFWTDGEDMYCSYNRSTYTFNYILDKTTSRWQAKTWSGLIPSSGSYIWNDGTHIYYSQGANQYVYRKTLT